MDSKPLISVQSLEFSFGRHQILKNIHFEVPAGKWVALVGPNGSGKSTLLKILAGLLRPQKGVIKFLGKTLKHQSLSYRARMGLGYLAQQSTIFKGLTVLENLRSVPHPDLDKVEAMLELIGLSEHRHQWAESLSGGERRRLEIGRLLLIQPKLLLCDEPFAALDPEGAQRVATLLSGVVQSGGSVWVTDHHMDMLLRQADLATLLIDGQLRAWGTPEDLLQNSLFKRYDSHSF